MKIKEIANTIIRGEKALVFPLKLDEGTGWIVDQEFHHVLDVRGWGYLQYADDDKGAELQDGIAEWVVETLNKEYESIKNEN